MQAQQARKITEQNSPQAKQLYRVLQEIRETAALGDSSLWVYNPHWQLDELLCSLGYETSERENGSALLVTW